MSEEEFDAALAQHAQRLIVLEASLTWCRPCKGFERSYEVPALFCELLRRSAVG